MAAQKEYRMLFTLASAFAGNFSGAFQKAQQELNKLNQAQKELAKSQSDVSAMKKLGDEIKNTEDKARRMAEKLANLRDEINNTQNPSATLKNKFVDLAGEAAKTAQKLQEKKDKLEELRKSLEASGYDVSDLKKLEDQLTEAMKKNAAEIDDLNGKMQNGIVGMDEFADAIVSGGILDALTSVAKAYGDCVKAAADFEYSMSNVEALSGANSLELEQLTSKALDLAASTKYTALEVGDAMGYMGMAGWSAEEMLGGMSGVINLAAASGEDLAAVSDIVTDNLTAFHMKASQTSEMADILAAAATNSNTNVEIMGETFKNSAAIAGALGYSIKDVATAVGIMANNGIKGSIAGTALRNVFNGLLKGVTLTSEAFGEYEMNVVKEDGTMLSFAETLDLLRTKFSMMTEAEKVMNAKEIGGMRGYNGLLSLVNATADDYASLASSIDNSAGAAQRMANIKLDNLNGQLTIMKSAWDAIKITLGSEFRDELKMLVQGFTEVLHFVNELLNINPAVTKSLIAFAGGLTAVVTALNAYKIAAGVVGTITKTLGVSMIGLSSAMVGVAAVVGVIVGAYAAYKETDDALRNSLTATSRAQYDEMKSLEDQYDAIVAAQGATSDSAMELKARLDAVTKSYNDNSKTARDFAKEQKDIANAYKEMTTAQDQSNERLDLKEGVTGRLVERLEGLVDANGKLIGSEAELETVISLLNEEIPSLNLSFDKETSSINKTTSAVKGLVRAKIEYAKYEANINALAEQERQETALVKAEADAAAELAARQKELDDARARQVQQGDDAINLTYKEEEAVYKATVAHKEAADRLEDHRQRMAELNASVEEYLGLQATDTDSPEGVIKTYVAQLQLLTDEYQKVYEAAYDSIHGQYTAWSEAAEVVPEKIGDLNKNLEGQIKYWQEYNENLQFLDSYASGSGLDGLKDLINTLASSAGSEKSVNLIAGLTEAAKKGDTKAIEDLVKNMAELEEQQKSTADEYGQFVTDFDENSKELIAKTEDAIAGLSLDEEAAKAAKDTLEAYISEMSNPDYVRRIQTAIGAFKVAVNSGITSATTSATPSEGTGHYASGTSSAPGGWALVGEEGPELLHMKGGEQVLNHGDTVRTLTSGQTASNNNINVAFNIEGNADGNTVQSLQLYAEDFASRVMDVINGANADAARRAYV